MSWGGRQNDGRMNGGYESGALSVASPRSDVLPSSNANTSSYS